jgi:hypothetical protein
VLCRCSTFDSQMMAFNIHATSKLCLSVIFCARDQGKLFDGRNVQLTAIAEDSQLSFNEMTVFSRPSSSSNFSWIIEINLRTWVEDFTASAKYPISPLWDPNLFPVSIVLVRWSSNWSKIFCASSNQAEMTLKSSVVPLMVVGCVEKSRECCLC